MTRSSCSTQANDEGKYVSGGSARSFRREMASDVPWEEAYHRSTDPAI